MKAILTLLVICLGVFTAVAQGPKMVFETNEIDYGTIAHSSDPLRVFKFTNRGNQPLVIKAAKGSCGCTVPSYPKAPIAPGESGTIEVRYDTQRTGPFQKTVELTTNEGDATHILRIKGSVNAAPATEDAVPTAAPGLMNGGR